MWTCQRTSIEIALNLPERQCIEGASMRPGCQDLKWNLHFERRKPWIFERCALRWTSLQRHKISSWQCFLQKRRQLRKETGTSLQYQFKINIACSVHFDMNPAAYGHYCRARVTYTERRPIKSGHCGVVGKRAGRSLLRRDISTQVLLLQSCKETTHCSRKETFVISISIVKIHLGDTQGQGSFNLEYTCIGEMLICEITCTGADNESWKEQKSITIIRREHWQNWVENVSTNVAHWRD